MGDVALRSKAIHTRHAILGKLYLLGTGGGALFPAVHTCVSNQSFLREDQMADRIIFVCILVLAGVYFWATQQIPSLEIGDPLGPKAFPRLLGIGLLITAAMLLAEILRDRKAVKRTEASGEAAKTQTSVIVGTVVATAIFFVSFEAAGYILSVTLYLLAMTNVFNKKGRWVTNSLTSIVYGVGSYFIFTSALGVNLPKGILPF